MVILPAIDLKDGKCVRLRQGRADDVTVYGDDPAAQAKDWAEQGGRELHVVDLDGAFAGTPRHAETIARVIGSAGLDDSEFLSKAVELYGEKIAVGIDARDGYVQTKGWVETTRVKATDLAAAVARLGVKTIIYTDPATDGMLGGPNLPQMAAIRRADVRGHGVRWCLLAVRRREPEGAQTREPARGHRRQSAYDGRTTLREMNVAAL